MIASYVLLNVGTTIYDLTGPRIGLWERGLMRIVPILVVLVIVVLIGFGVRSICRTKDFLEKRAKQHKSNKHS